MSVYCGRKYLSRHGGNMQVPHYPQPEFKSRSIIKYNNSTIDRFVCVTVTVVSNPNQLGVGEKMYLCVVILYIMFNKR